MRLLAILLAIAAAPSVIDSIFRLVLVVASGRSRQKVMTMDIRRWLVIIPARGEGSHVEPTLASVGAAKGEAEVRTILVLDGEDAEAAAIGSRHGAIVVTKTPPGPTKGAALGWLAEKYERLVADADSVLLVDVGSTLAPAFFDRFSWPHGCDAAQAFLHGRGAGVGAAATASEAEAQAREDIGRQNLGWSVRLRGTGTALRPRAFLDLAPQLSTQVEDTELSLLLSASGLRSAMSSPAAWVADDKPDDPRVAASQRSRWLAGRAELLFRRGGAIASLIARKPMEGLGFLFELFGRPLSLTVLLRLAAGGALVAIGAMTGTTWAEIAGAIALCSGIADIALHSRGASAAAVGSMIGAWLFALLLAPRAFFRWVRTRRS